LDGKEGSIKTWAALSRTREATLVNVGSWKNRTFELPSVNGRFVPTAR
jgi:hypothetical protein